MTDRCIRIITAVQPIKNSLKTLCINSSACACAGWASCLVVESKIVVSSYNVFTYKNIVKKYIVLFIIFFCQFFFLTVYYNYYICIYSFERNVYFIHTAREILKNVNSLPMIIYLFFFCLFITSSSICNSTSLSVVWNCFFFLSFFSIENVRPQVKVWNFRIFFFIIILFVTRI